MLISLELALSLPGENLYAICKSVGITSHRQVRSYLRKEGFDRSYHCYQLPSNLFVNDSLNASASLWLCLILLSQLLLPSKTAVKSGALH